MDIFLLYLFTRLPVSMTGLLLAAVLLTIGTAILYAIWNFEEEEKAKMPCTITAVCALLSFVVALIVPTQKEAALILAGSAVLEVAKTDSAKRIAGKSVQLIEQTLDGYLKKEAK